MRSVLFAAPLMLALACGGSTGAATGPDADGAQKTGTVATDFAARDTNGKTVRLSDYLGKQAILLDFWATFCEPCLAEMPHLRRIYEKERPRGFTILAISMDGPETIAQVPSFASRNSMTFPVLLDEDSHVAAIYNPKKSAPLSVLIDKRGQVVRVHEGYNPGDEEVLAAAVAKVLDAPATAP
jgi:peroxiredoxin